MGEREREIARRGVEAFNAGDVEALVEMSHPEGELRGLRWEVEGTYYRGPEGIRLVELRDGLIYRAWTTLDVDAARREFDDS